MHFGGIGQNFLKSLFLSTASIFPDVYMDYLNENKIYITQ